MHIFKLFYVISLFLGIVIANTLKQYYGFAGIPIDVISSISSAAPQNGDAAAIAGDGLTLGQEMTIVKLIVNVTY